MLRSETEDDLIYYIHVRCESSKQFWGGSNFDLGGRLWKVGPFFEAKSVNDGNEFDTNIACYYQHNKFTDIQM